jgi:trichothecene 3-O-acetyltransferase
MLSPIDWLMPRSYITQILCFPSNDAQIPNVLQTGLAGVLKDVPYLACAIISQEPPKGAVGVSEACYTVDNLFSCRELSAEVDYNILRARNFPPSALSELKIFPDDLHHGKPAPVFRAVLSHAERGYFLCVSVHHSTTDIMGLGSLLRIWASHCKYGSSRMIRFGAGWIDRRPLSNCAVGVDSGVPLLLRLQDSTSTTSAASNTITEAKLDTRIFKLRAQDLQALKTNVNDHSISTGLSWVSTSDIVTTLLWSAVVAAESKSDIENVTRQEFIRFPVSLRNRFESGVPGDYLGAAIGLTSAAAKAADLLEIASGNGPETIKSLSRVASALRAAIRAVDAVAIQEMISYIKSQEDVTKVKLGPNDSSATSLSIVSWADQGVYELDWGAAIGHCEAVRVQKFKGKRYPIVLPRLGNGDIEVAMSLDPETLDRMDAAWFMKIIC